MKIMSWNVNGIRAVHKKGFFEHFVEEYKPDILCLQETKAQQHESPTNLIGYHEFWNSAEKKGYSGTAIFSREKPIRVEYNIPENIIKKYEVSRDTYGDPNTEGRVIMAEYKDYYIVTVYTPNSKDDLSRVELRHKQWDPAFLAYCAELQKNKPLVFCGDLNVAHTEADLANPKQNIGKKGFTSEEREGIDQMIKKGFVDTFRMFTQGNGQYTWWSNFANSRNRNIGWRIDYIFVSEPLVARVTSAEILPQIMRSDHCPVSIEIM